VESRAIRKLPWLLALLFLSSVAAAQTIPPDITVAADGSGDFTTVQKAVQSIPNKNSQRIVLLIKDGVYKEKIRIDAPYVTLEGQSRTGTRIEFPQLAEDFTKNPDDIGRAVVNINGSDAVLQNLTIHNTAGQIGPHAFAIYGNADRTVITDADVLSEGADTLSLWYSKRGRYYHARCNFRGSVDFVCPRGWCYLTDCTFYEMKDTAAVWHDGHVNKDMKLVLRNCKFDGAAGWYLARHHQDAQFFFLNCTFSQSMIDRPPKRVIYPLSATAPTTQGDINRNKDYDKVNLWGERACFFNCHRDGGDYPWFADNLTGAPGSPKPDRITPAWTFANTWDPESSAGPKIRQLIAHDHKFSVVFTESVTVKGHPRLIFTDGSATSYVSGSGSATLLFVLPPDATAQPKSLDLTGGWIIGTQASATTRPAELSLP
jgi:pectinesterase